MNEKMDLRVSGSSNMPGGEYGKVSISGSGKIQGDVKCDRLHCSGAARIQGNVITEEIHCSGAVKIEGDLVCSGEAATSGALDCYGSVKADQMRCSGSVKIQADLRCRSLTSSGVCQVQGGVEAETVELMGVTEIEGLLNAETVTISADGKSRIGDIGCATIRVRLEQPGRFWGKMFVSHGKGLVTKVIEGDTVDLEYTQADVVRCKQAIIGEGCHIRRVEYTESCMAEEGTVEELVQV